MRREEGFTLIELLFVVLIIGILAAIALPAFLGQRSKAQDVDAKSNAGNIRVFVESCAAQSDHTYADCATAQQIESSGIALGMVPLPPLNQFAGAGAGGNDSNGVKNGAQCIEQSNGQRACEQTTPPGDTTPPPDTTTGGSAPDVGDCVEGGSVELSCVGIVATSSGYTITAVSRANHIFKIVNSGGRVTRPCEPAGSGGCPGDGSW